MAAVSLRIAAVDPRCVCGRHLDEDDGAGCVLERRAVFQRHLDLYFNAYYWFRASRYTYLPFPRIPATMIYWYIWIAQLGLLLVPHRVHYAAAVCRADRRHVAIDWRHQNGERQTSAVAKDAACGCHGNGERSHNTHAGRRRCHHVGCRVPNGRRFPACPRYSPLSSLSVFVKSNNKL